MLKIANLEYEVVFCEKLPGGVDAHYLLPRGAMTWGRRVVLRATWRASQQSPFTMINNESILLILD
jgi:hypothetical protein